MAIVTRAVRRAIRVSVFLKFDDMRIFYRFTGSFAYTCLPAGRLRMTQVIYGEVLVLGREWVRVGCWLR